MSAAAILRSGGLLRFGKDYMANIEVASDEAPARPQTLFETLDGDLRVGSLARHGCTPIPPFPITTAAVRRLLQLAQRG